MSARPHPRVFRDFLCFSCWPPHLHVENVNGVRNEPFRSFGTRAVCDVLGKTVVRVCVCATARRRRHAGFALVPTPPTVCRSTSTRAGSPVNIVFTRLLYLTAGRESVPDTKARQTS
jgi:hypothetical protein